MRTFAWRHTRRVMQTWLLHHFASLSMITFCHLPHCLLIIPAPLLYGLKLVAFTALVFDQWAIRRVTCIDIYKTVWNWLTCMRFHYIGAYVDRHECEDIVGRNIWRRSTASIPPTSLCHHAVIRKLAHRQRMPRQGRKSWWYSMMRYSFNIYEGHLFGGQETSLLSSLRPRGQWVISSLNRVDIWCYPQRSVS